MSTVGEKVLSEIERVTAKRERWRGYAEKAGAQADFSLSIHMMTTAIERGKRAIADQNAIDCIAALEYLGGYDDDD